MIAKCSGFSTAKRKIGAAKRLEMGSRIVFDVDDLFS